MSQPLPRVTYANVGVDLTGVHDHLDSLIPQFKKTMLGRFWPNVIAGETDEDGVRYDVVSPIDRATIIGTFIAGSPSAVARATTAAQKQFPAWSAKPWRERVAVFRRWAERLEATKYELAIASLLEVGKSRIEALGEADEVIDLVRYYCAEIERNNGYVQDLDRAFAREETASVLRPLGVFGVIAPFNYPLALAVNMVAGAVITGNTVVFKPSSGCALSAYLLLRAIQAAGVPGGVINLVAGGDATGRAVVEQPGLAGIAFTGSHAAGMAIFRTLANGPVAKQVIAEMGGKNPAYVTAKADLDVAAQGVARSAFGLQGQKCSSCSVVYVQRAIRDEFVTRLTRYTQQLKVGNPEQRDVFMGPLYSPEAAARFREDVMAARRDGKVIFGGDLASDGDGAGAGGHYAQPTLVEVPAGHSLVMEEQFLPLLALRTFEDLPAALQEGNAVRYGLSAGIYTTDHDELKLFLDRAEAGVLYANRASGATTGAWPGIQSFCGWKGSGVSNKGGLGPHYLPQFMREQSRTIMHQEA
ncbi:MAG: aldehyde dehydrogenase family protein [Betaproteobacteria bacterium]